MLRPAAFLALSLLLAGCASEVRYLLDPPAAADRAALRISTLEVREVSLPAYAEAAEIAVEQPDGGVVAIKSTFWADNPARGVTLTLARTIEERSTVTAAAEPWPLDEPAQAQLDVRVERMLARADGTFELSGQYAIASREGATREFIERFAIRRPIGGTDTQSIANAAGAALGDLAGQIVARLRR